MPRSVPATMCSTPTVRRRPGLEAINIAAGISPMTATSTPIGRVARPDIFRAAATSAASAAITDATNQTPFSILMSLCSPCRLTSLRRRPGSQTEPYVPVLTCLVKGQPLVTRRG